MLWRRDRKTESRKRQLEVGAWVIEQSTWLSVALGREPRHRARVADDCKGIVGVFLRLVLYSNINS